MTLNQLDHIPDGLLRCEATDLQDLLGGPTVIHLAGSRDPALFVSVLMHGNETTGWYAVRELLNKFYHNNAHRPRSLSLFIANTSAAQQCVRHLTTQPDFNRVWPGSELAPTPEHQLMLQVQQLMRQRGVFASIDVHNNTGLNPHYACVNNLNPATLKLATLFARTVVYFIRPVGVQSMAMSELCPAVTLECGKANQAIGYKHALRYLDACVHLLELPDTAVAPHDIDLFHTTATVKVPAHIKFGFSEKDCSLTLPADLERYNFRELPIGTSFGKIGSMDCQPLLVCSETGDDVFSEYFEVQANTIRSRKSMMPSMLTSDLEVVRQDCLCYLMERYSNPTNAT